jgi:NitT/TauT family transport system substrate-binding protein
LRRAAILGLAASLCAAPAAAESSLRVGWCAKTVSAAAAPFAVATKMGWLAQAGFSLDLVPLPGSADCVKFIGTGELRYALPSIEPLAQFRPQGITAKVFYTAYQGFTYGIAVPADSPIKTIKDLKGKTIGITSLASGGNLVGRALAAEAGLDPDKDVSIVVAGEGAQTAALLRSHQVDAVSQFDTQFAMIENAGIPMRRLASASIDHFPANGFIALEETLKLHRAEAATLAQAYAKGTIFAISNPEAAVLHDDVKTLEARIVNWRLEKGGVKRWGESDEANYQAYLDFLLKWGVLKAPVKAQDVVTNDVLAEIDAFDPAEVAAAAKAFRYASQ